MRAWLRHDGDEYPVDLADLDETIRSGALPGDAELKHPPWTGSSFHRLRDIPALRDALDAPDARFADYLRQRRPTWLTGAVAVLVMATAMFQSSLAGSDASWATARLQRTFHQWMIGLEPTLLDGRWWTVWASQLSHADLLHALFNVPIIAYCGYRVEQALAPSGALAVMAAALLAGSVSIIALEDAPVFGSSIIAYGLWAAQIVIGLRMGEAIPPRLRGRYGMGNLIFFAPLYAAGLFNTDVSHIGHVGGIIGGVLVAFFLFAETMAGGAVQERARGRVLLTVGLLSAAPLLLLAAAARAPGLAYGPYTTHLVEGAGVRVRLPQRMADHAVPVGALQGWRPSENGNEPVFVDQVFLEAPLGAQDNWVAAWWARHLGSPAGPVRAIEPLSADWQSFQVKVGRWHVTEHQLQRGRWLLRAGYVTRRPASALAGRRRLYASILSTLEVLEPPSLVDVRARWSTAPEVPVLQRAYARELRYAGRPAEADTVLAGVKPRPEIAQERLALWREYPDSAPPDAVAWLLPHLTAAAPEAADFHLHGLAWLVEQGHCAEAAAHRQRLPPSVDVGVIMAGCPPD